MAAVRSRSLCVSPISLVSILVCLPYSPQLTNQAAFLSPIAHTQPVDCSRERPGHCQPWEALPLGMPCTLSMQSTSNTCSLLTCDHGEAWLRADCLVCWKRGRLVGVHKTERFHTKNNIRPQIALDIYKIWEHYPALCLSEEHKYPPFSHTFSNCHGRRPHCGSRGLTQPTPALFSSSPAQGPQPPVHGTEHCLNTRRYQDHFLLNFSLSAK